MFLFKASGATYGKVVRQAVHAFPCSPVEVDGDEFVLLSKNKADCAMLEKQVQRVAKLLRVRPGTADELDRLFPKVGAGSRFRYVVELYWVRPLRKPFNLSDVADFDYKRYDPVQGFAKLVHSDALALLRHLQSADPQLLLDLANSPGRPDAGEGKD